VRYDVLTADFVSIEVVNIGALHNIVPCWYNHPPPSQTSLHIIMSSKLTLICVVAALALAANVQETQAFAPVAFTKPSSLTQRFAEETERPESAFVPAEPAVSTEDDEDDDLDAVEGLGRGSSKVGLRSAGIFSFLCAFDSQIVVLTNVLFQLM
jgi:predicted flap endonuclease-1-like 5' DNA nuclease